MQPAPFQCGHCGKLMAVSSEHLGQQVRCPHCQQVVIAPPPSGPALGASSTGETPVPPPSPELPDTVVLTPPSAGASEDIFAPVDLNSSVFALNEAPRVEMPAESLPPTLAGGGAAPPPASQPPAPLVPFAQSENTAVMTEGGAPPWPVGALTETPPSPTQAPTDEARYESAADSARAAKRTETKAPWFLLLVFCPLLLYAIVISIFAILLYRQHQELQEQFRIRFDNMPDVGDDPGVRRGKKVSLTDRYKAELATLPLPSSLCTTLGKPLRIGDLQVTPNRVERMRVSVIVENSRPEPCTNDSLVLYLDLKNLSTDYAFAPLDNYFDRYWHPGVDPIPPLTLLEVGKKYRCYGGPAHWYPRGDYSNPREWVEGRSDRAELLQPGEEKQMFVCTDGDDSKAAAVLFGEQSGQEYRGPFLWRVRVRRGLVRFQDKDYSRTAVIGVRFTDSDIHGVVPQSQ